LTNYKQNYDQAGYTADRSEHDAASLYELLAQQVIPEIVKASTKHQDKTLSAAHTEVAEDDIESAIHLIVEQAADGRDKDALEYAYHLVAKGMPLRVLYIDVLAGAAKKLGEMWEDDTLHFSKVTIGLGILQTILHEIRDTESLQRTPMDQSRRILLARAPNEQHTFGILTLEKFFENAGWATDGGLDLEAGPELLTSISEEWYGVAGISIGSDTNIPFVMSLIPQMRKASKNPRIKIMVGGPIFLDEQITAETVGADIAAVNAELAVEDAENLVADLC
jgi:methanogenic corrinoid protein MtbC1